MPRTWSGHLGATGHATFQARAGKTKIDGGVPKGCHAAVSVGHEWRFMGNPLYFQSGVVRILLICRDSGSARIKIARPIPDIGASMFLL